MKISVESLPVAGEKFSFLIEPDGVKVMAQVSLGDEISFNYMSSNPPASNFLFIPVNAEGKKLKLTAKDAKGERYETEYVINPPKISVPKHPLKSKL